MKEDVWIDVYDNWVIVTIKNRNDARYIVSRDRVLQIVVGTKEGNELNIPK